MTPANLGALVSGESSRGFRAILLFLLGFVGSLPAWLWLFTR